MESGFLNYTIFYLFENLCFNFSISSLSKYSSEYPQLAHTYLCNKAADKVVLPVITYLPDPAGVIFPGIIIRSVDPHFGHFPVAFIYSLLIRIIPLYYGLTLFTFRIFLRISLAYPSDPGTFGWVLSGASRSGLSLTYCLQSTKWAF